MTMTIIGPLGADPLIPLSNPELSGSDPLPIPRQTKAEPGLVDTQPSAKHVRQETADEYEGVVAQFNAEWRVIECHDHLQWIVQRRKKGGAERPWRGVHYCRTRDALLRLCATSCGPLGPRELASLARLPERIGGAT